MTTPIAVLTNLAYILAGVLVMRGQLWKFSAIGMEDLRLRTLASWLVGGALIILGLASGWYHFAAGDTANDPTQWIAPIAQYADEGAMYLAFSVLDGVLWRNWAWQNAHSKAPSIYGWFYEAPIWGSLGLGISLAVLAPQIDSMYMIPALALICLGGVWVARGFQKSLAFFIGLLAIVVIRQLPEEGLWGNPDFWDYDIVHGFWHLFTAYILYKIWTTNNDG